MPKHDVVSALLASKQEVRPEEWIALLKNELQSPELLNSPLGGDIKALQGKPFSAAAKMFSTRFGISINSPAELIIALWIYLDRQKSITTKNPAMSFSEMLGGQSLSEAISKAKILMKGYPLCQ